MARVMRFDVMAEILGPKVTLGQVPPVTEEPDHDSDMAGGIRPTKVELQEFARRFNVLCDDRGVPPKGKGRQQSVAKIFKVSQKAARKWLEGIGFPEPAMQIVICKHFECAYEWFMTGRGPKTKHDLIDRRVIFVAERLLKMEPSQLRGLMAVFQISDEITFTKL